MIGEIVDQITLVARGVLRVLMERMLSVFAPEFAAEDERALFFKEPPLFERAKSSINRC